MSCHHHFRSTLWNIQHVKALRTNKFVFSTSLERRHCLLFAYFDVRLCETSDKFEKKPVASLAERNPFSRGNVAIGGDSI